MVIISGQCASELATMARGKNGIRVFLVGASPMDNLFLMWFEKLKQNNGHMPVKLAILKAPYKWSKDLRKNGRPSNFYRTNY